MTFSGQLLSLPNHCSGSLMLAFSNLPKQGVVSSKHLSNGDNRHSTAVCSPRPQAKDIRERWAREVDQRCVNGRFYCPSILFSRYHHSPDIAHSFTLHHHPSRQDPFFILQQVRLLDRTHICIKRSIPITSRALNTRLPPSCIHDAYRLQSTGLPCNRPSRVATCCRVL